MLTSIQSLPVVVAPVFEDLPWLLHGFGLRDISIASYLEAFGVRKAIIPHTHQTHGDTVHLFKSTSLQVFKSQVLEGDAFITDKPGLVCWVRTADCLPILIADAKNKIVAAVHAGWRGTAGQIILRTLEAMQKEFKCEIENLRIALGPAIGGHCYKVGEDVIRELEKGTLFPGPWVEVQGQKSWTLDIAFANLHLIEAAKVSRSQIYLSLACTACDSSKFSSYRRDGDKRGEQANFIVVR